MSLEKLKEMSARKPHRRVLLIEDDLFDYQVIKRCFKTTPHIILEHVESLGEAHELVRGEAFDCFLLDWYLPDGEGELFLRYSSDVMPWVPTVVMTSGNEHTLTEKALELGAQDYITKGTFEPDDLVHAIDYAIARKNAERLRWNKLQQERSSFVNQIVAGVAHEINNPIAWIRSNIDLLHMQVEQDELDPQEALELCQECTEGIERISSVVKVLRTYAESLDESLELRDLHLVLERCLADIKAKQEWSVKATLTSISSLPLIYIDQGAMLKAMCQIILNAFQAAERGNQTPRVNVHLSLSDRRVVVDVHDSGVGMEEAIAARIFEPFYSSQRATNLGMGLAIAHEVIMSHRGEIEVKGASPLGGAWIQVRLPVV